MKHSPPPSSPDRVSRPIEMAISMLYLKSDRYSITYEQRDDADVGCLVDRVDGWGRAMYLSWVRCAAGLMRGGAGLAREIPGHFKVRAIVEMCYSSVDESYYRD